MAKVKITIDDQELEVEQGTNLIEAAAQIGTKIPHYCYHAGLKPDGNCRMCLVNVEKAPKPLIGCKTGASEGMVVHTKTPEIEKIRRSVMEFMLINHPLDCPTCDQAGECRLQNYYMEYDRIPSRYQEEKVHKDKMVNLGAGIMLDEERCIVCTRCVRVCQEVAKDEELYVQQRGNHAMVATFPGKDMKNPYAGNTIDVCPVGALTSKDFRYKKRVWLLSHADSICPGCSRGCNTSVHHADDKVFRLKPRHNDSINKYWMCDEGRYAYKSLNDNRQLRPAYIKQDRLSDSSYTEALESFISKIESFDLTQVGFVASAMESNESINSFVSFAKEQFRSDHVYFSKNEPDNPYSDDILITADKNPNTKHIESLELKAVTEIDSHIKAIIVQRELSDRDLKWVLDNGIQILAVYATNKNLTLDSAQTAFPIPTYVEQDGHFTNLDGVVQEFKTAYEAWSDVLPMASYLNDLILKLRHIKKAS